MKLEIEGITEITEGVCKGFEEVTISAEGEDLEVLLNREKEILYYYSNISNRKIQDRIKEEFEQVIQNGSYRLQALFMEKHQETYLENFRYVFKREELKKHSVIGFKKISSSINEHEYILYEGDNTEWNVTYCFPEFELTDSHTILDDGNFIEKLKKMGFTLFNLERSL